MTTYPDPSRSILQYISPYQPGKPIEEVKRELSLTDIIKLASNENHLGAAPSAMKVLREKLAEINYYPDGAGYELKKALSDKTGYKPDEIILGNGSTEIVELACEAFLDEGCNAVTGWPAFFKYRIAIRIMGGIPVEVPLKNFTHDPEAMLSAINDKTKLIFIADPNNPTGTMVSPSELEQFILEVPENIVVVVDQAYYEYVPPEKRIDVMKFIRQGRNVIALRTFSKAYGLAGLRVGYGFARPELVTAMNKVREAFNCNMMGQLAAAAALDDDDFVRKTVELNREGLQTFYRGFDNIGLNYVPDSMTNFVLVDTGRDVILVFQELLKRGVIVRPMRGYDLPACFRVSTGLPKDNEYFIEKISEVMRSFI
ncbi:histidinol-phosphate transaminase [bacterium]|nr:histidinol-phosphate transaminase [bacterium]